MASGSSLKIRLLNASRCFCQTSYWSLSSGLYATEAEARQAAMAQFGELNRGRVQLEFNGEGRPDVFAEALVQAEDFDPDVDGEFLIRTVTHTFTKEGFVTSIAMESAGSGRDTG